jgi:hypothetical protein
MLWKELEKKEQAPKFGYLLVYTRQKILLKEYKNQEDLKKYLDDIELLEVHLFDQNKEYRAITSESKRFHDKFVEHIAEFKDTNSAEIFREKVILESEWKDKELTVLNHVVYDENGMAAIDDYRLIISEMEGEHE